MTNLIHRLEAAEGPSRELDAEIARAIGNKVEIFRVPKGHPVLAEGGGLEFMTKPNGDKVGIPPYTASLDAAVSLVPEGMAYVLAQSRAKNQGSAQVFEEKRTAQVLALSRDPEIHMEIAATPALALCIAALKAREAGNG